MPVKGSTVSTIKTAPYDRLREEAKKQRRNISDTLDIILDSWEKNYEKNKTQTAEITKLEKEAVESQ